MTWFLKEEKICYKMVYLHFVFKLSQLSEIVLQINVVVRLSARKLFFANLG